MSLASLHRLPGGLAAGLGLALALPVLVGTAAAETVPAKPPAATKPPAAAAPPVPAKPPETKPPAPKQTAMEKALTGAKLLGKGVVEAYSKGKQTLLVLPRAVFRRPFVWYAEYVSVPTGIVNYLDLGGIVIRFQHREDRVFVRDLTASFGKRVAARTDPRPGQDQGPGFDPIELSVRRANEPPVMAVLPVLATAPDGRVLVDVTKLFSNDIETMSARPLVLKTGLTPVSVNPAASYITSVRVFPENFGVRAHLTFVGRSRSNPVAPPRGVSLRIGHSLVMLPARPMPARHYDPRVGFFWTGASVTGFRKYTEYGADGSLEKTRAVIMRYRLQKKDPTAAVSDPVKPIVFYLGREVPDQWRPYIKAGVEMWEPAFRAAGFSNAIVARDAPPFDKDPSWTPEDARHSVIRWLAQPNPNARGPHIVDPRSGEILSSHIEIWPQVLSIFSRYYFAVNAGIDPKATSLPLSRELQGRLLQYVVAHEVGHGIGLRHNHMASTAYTVAQMRDPKFADKWGAAASIMAYGRFNQVAQPGDGVTKFLPSIGPYDFFAIKWGYGVHGPTPADDDKALDALATKAQADRRLLWAAGEIPDEVQLWYTDPRVLKENTGAERLEATRLGVANVLRALKKLTAATAGNDVEFRAAFEQFQSHQVRFIKSVAKLIGGGDASPWSKTGPFQKLVPAAMQREAVRYLLGEGARSLDAYRDPALASRASILGVPQAIDRLQGSLVREVLDGPTLSLLEANRAADPTAYGVLDLARDSHDTVWGDLSAAPRWQRALQRAYLDRVATILKAQAAAPDARTKRIGTLVARGYSTPFATLATATGADTVFPAWARDMLPKLAARLEAAAQAAKSEDDRLHFLDMAERARRVVRRDDK